MGTVYIHTTPDGKKYVGATHMNPNKRFAKGLRYKYQFFYQAVLKFGWENISHQLYEVDTEEELKYLEKYLISYYDTTNPEKGYNITKDDSTQDHGYDHPQYGNGGSYSHHKEIFLKYQASDKGKEVRKKYDTSEKGKSTHKKYDTSDKGKSSHKKYSSSEKGKEAQKRFKNSEKGKESIKLASKKYYNSEKGKLTIKQYQSSEKGKLAIKQYQSSEKGKEARRRANQRYREKKKNQTQNE